jgi:predicted nucleotidyltransferase
MITMQLIQQRKHEIMQIAAKYGAHNLRVFGSVARGEAGPDSDLDLLVDFEQDEPYSILVDC